MGCARVLAEDPRWAPLIEFLETPELDLKERQWAFDAVLELREAMVPRFLETNVYVCGPGIRACACGFASTHLCDYVKERGHTCNRPLCELCRTPTGWDKDLCPEHAPPIACPTAVQQQIRGELA